LSKGQSLHGALAFLLSTLYLVAVALALLLPSSEGLAAAAARSRILLNQDWEVAEAKSLDYSDYGLLCPKLGWRKVNLPMIQPLSEPNHCLWYRRKFHLSSPLLSAIGRGMSLWLTFTDVRYLARVYVNGRLAGEHFGGYLPFSLPCGHLLQAGENELVIGVQDWTSAISPKEPRLHSYQGQSEEGEDEPSDRGGSANLRKDTQGIPAGDYAVPEYPGFPEPGTIIAPIGGSHRRAGICGQVYLEAIADTHIAAVSIKPELDQRKVRVEVEIAAEQKKATWPEGELRSTKDKAADDPTRIKPPLILTFWVRELGLLNKAQAKAKEETLAAPYRKIGQAAVEQQGGQEQGGVGTGHLLAVFETRVKKAKLWDPDHPFLYQMKVTLGQGEDDRGRNKKVIKVMDEVEVRYGLRDWKIDGPYFILNGERINLRAASIIYDHRLTEDGLRQRICRLKQANINHLRFHSEPPPSWTLDVCDEEGMLATVESAIYGSYVGRYDTSFDSAFWPQAKEHWLGLVKRDINHPCVIIWGIENETVEYDAGRGGEVRFMELGLGVKRLDPQRPIMYEGGMDCFGAGDIINLHYPHEFPFWNCLPNDAWWLEQAKPGRGDPQAALPFTEGEKVALADSATFAEPKRQSLRDQNSGCRKEEWPKRTWQDGEGILLDSLWRWQPNFRFCWGKDKPLYLGEELYLPSPTPDPYTILSGDEAYRQWKMGKEKGKGEVWRYYLEAYRQAEVSGVCPWVITGEEKEDNPLYRACQESFKPIVVLLKERNSRFWEGEEVRRTLTICNDERRDKSQGLSLDDLAPEGIRSRQPEDAFIPEDTFILDWWLAKPTADKEAPDDLSFEAKGENTLARSSARASLAACGREVFSLPCGHTKAVTIRFKIPPITQSGLKKQEWQLRVRVIKQGRIRDERAWQIWAYRQDVGRISDSLPQRVPIFLYDPDGQTAKVLTRAGVKYRPIACPADLDNLLSGQGQDIGNQLSGQGEKSTGQPEPPTLLSHQPECAASPKLGLLILGKNAFLSFEGRKITVALPSPWQELIDRFVSQGGVVVAFEQEFLPTWLPSQITVNPLHQATMAFPGRGSHPVLEGISAEELRFWGNDHVVSRYDLNLPERGDWRSLVDSGGSGGLIYSPLLEVRWQDGRMIFCQMLAVEKWDKEPAARMLFKNLLSYAAEKAGQNSRLQPKTANSTIMIGGLKGRVKPGEKIMVFDGQAANWEWLGQSQADILDFVKGGGRVLLREIDEQSIPWVQKILPLKVRKISGPDEMPIEVVAEEIKLPGMSAAAVREPEKLPVAGAISAGENLDEAREDDSIALYSRDLYWVEPHSEFRYERAGFDRGIADYAIEVEDSQKIDHRTDVRLLSWTRPHVLLKVNYGRGFFLIDQVKWPRELARGGFNAGRGIRYAYSILHYLGLTIQDEVSPLGEEILIQAENMSCLTPGQPLIRCRSHDYWTLCSNNFISERVHFGHSGEYTFTARAKCRRPDLPPLMVLTVDGLTAGMQIVSSILWESFRFTAWVEEGEHEVSLSLVNADDPYGEKYLYVDWLRISD